MQRRFADIVSALVYTLAEEGSPSRKNAATAFVLRQHARMPDFLRGPIAWLTLVFDASALLIFGRSFRWLTPARKKAWLALWRGAWFPPARDLVRFYESLIAIDDGGAPDFATAPSVRRPSRCEVLVIGSGPGGAITAATLAEAGRQVVILEDAPALLHHAPSFSAAEMETKYRCGGLTPALGSTKIAYVEGRCVGGGSEINSGLYHRTPPEILDEWRRDYGTQISEAELREHFEAIERDLSISYLPCPAPAASLKLHEGATNLGWQSLEVPRWFSYDAPVPQRQSMSQTYLPRALAAGAQLLPGTRATRIQREGTRWRVKCETAHGHHHEIEAENVFLAAGAIQTPALLRRSGLTRNIGEQMQLHPTIKALAIFPEQVNARDLGVPVHQVKEFSPLISLGCSISSPSYLALGLLDHPQARAEVLRGWEKAAIYYGMIKPQGRGTIRTLPGRRDPLVRYSLTDDDRRHLATALRRLGEALLAAGATSLFPSVGGSAIIRNSRDLQRLPGAIDKASLMTIHLFSSCPMGEDRAVCATDSFGQVHGQAGLYISDASLLPTAPGVNPQGTVMALARRGAQHFLKS